MEEKYIICKYCAYIYNNNDNHVNNCVNNYNKDEGVLYCYGCGENNKNYSGSQILKEDKARCKDCVRNNKTEKFGPYTHLYQPTNKVELMHTDAQLLHYVCELKLVNFYNNQQTQIIIAKIHLLTTQKRDI